ncbi:MAG: glutaminyl-tRNA synthase (glutamine-hydrolyzing) subunit B [Candidatus Portnoybacteria bacterium RBG_13_40_8]|uniref:Aspartyl/glutamyl-tRNA(Asn/Gln) amidotransferase subunit B n=1 Tax=Candidatus Portnoybacteria bacterium RBG_13_40_8 TaxID=1801990 RepID=A0A1G2F1D6_9BACT|nr:MAG: glutaminyl-tRNA synthase (glutamine-hydrolyzing) subunit B [Candidatus Portnoybacteria bacterium RBG_13_40_8]OGZ36035.1 MAG: glutaminyl-tRNA synthase (glutamine-hydrolyzing) subunit B [Candidatus Portnoybacteria bacterium RIFCSPHIGHO2_01_FULL_39_19]
MKRQSTIGLEIHVELKTRTKMFCDCLSEPLKKEPNINICPVCTAQPGSLPVINKEAIESVIKVGLAVNCRIAEKSWFERKNYFYPDLPKGYQISQYEAPLCRDGYLEIDGKKIRIRRVHLEEDTGKLLHDQDDKYSLVDFNRAGVPLMELVTEPDVTSAVEARKFSQELQLIFKYLGISDADMEKGQMRVEANISLDMGTKVEIKNLNSFRSVERAIDYEIDRQKEILESKGQIAHETRGWNDNKQQTFSQRVKEEAEDYRYFPEPDLPPLTFSAEEIEKLGNAISELPNARKERFKREYKIPDLTIENLVIFKNLGDFFERTVSELKAWLKSGKIKTDLDKLIKLSANYILTEFPKYIYEGETKITPENFAELIYLTFIGEISSSGAQEVLREMFLSGKDPSQIIESKNLKQVSNEEELEIAVETIIKNNPQAIEDYKKGKETALQFLVGQAMRESKSKANPQILAKLIKKLIK